MIAGRLVRRERAWRRATQDGSEEEAAEPSFSIEVGQRLRSVRRIRGLSLDDVERESGGRWSASAVGAYERGFRNLSLPRLRDLADVLRRADGRAPRRGGPRPGGRARVAWCSTSSPCKPCRRRSPCCATCGRSSSSAGDFNGRVLSIRRDDLRAICSLLRTDEPDHARAARRRGAALRRRTQDRNRFVAVRRRLGGSVDRRVAGRPEVRRDLRRRPRAHPGGRRPRRAHQAPRRRRRRRRERHGQGDRRADPPGRRRVQGPSGPGDGHAHHRRRAQGHRPALHGPARPRRAGRQLHRQPGRVHHRRRPHQRQDRRAPPRAARRGAAGGTHARSSAARRACPATATSPSSAAAAPTPPPSRSPTRSMPHCAELYTDVPGVFSADPRLVPDAHRMATVSFDEMLEMTACGCPKPAMRSVEFARTWGVRAAHPISVHLGAGHLGARGGPVHGAGHRLGGRARHVGGQGDGHRRARPARHRRPPVPAARRRRRERRHDRAEHVGPRGHRHLLHRAARRPRRRARRSPPAWPRRSPPAG